MGDDFEFKPTEDGRPLRNLYEELKAKEPRHISVVAGLLIVAFLASVAWRLVADLTYRMASIARPIVSKHETLMFGAAKVSNEPVTDTDAGPGIRLGPFYRWVQTNNDLVLAPTALEKDRVVGDFSATM